MRPLNAEEISKKIYLSLLSGGLAAAFALPTSAQNTNSNTAIKPADSPSRLLLDSWNDIGRRLVAMAEDIPEDKFDFAPTPARRGFIAQQLHAAGANYYFINPARGRKPPEGDPERHRFKTRADLVAFVKKSFADGAALKGKKACPIPLSIPFHISMFGLAIAAWGFIEHSGNVTANSLFITGSPVLFLPSHGRRSISSGDPFGPVSQNRQEVGHPPLSFYPQRYAYGYRRGRSENILTISMPATNPPTCAHTATPPTSRPTPAADKVEAPVRN